MNEWCFLIIMYLLRIKINVRKLFKYKKWEKVLEGFFWVKQGIRILKI